MHRLFAGMVLCAVFALGPATAETRLALVIGNSAYNDSKYELYNPENDAVLVKGALKDAGFEVTEQKNLSASDMRKDIVAFAERVKRTQAVAAIIYFAGHGTSVDGKQYLIPVDVDVDSERDIKKHAILLDDVIAAVKDAKNLRLVVVDACRDGDKRAPATAFEEAIKDNRAVVFFSAVAGTVAIDNKRATTSYFAEAFARNLAKGGAVEELLKNLQCDLHPNVCSGGEPANTTNTADDKPSPVGYGLPSVNAFYFNATSDYSQEVWDAKEKARKAEDSLKDLPSRAQGAEDAAEQARDKSTLAQDTATAAEAERAAGRLSGSQHVVWGDLDKEGWHYAGDRKSSTCNRGKRCYGVLTKANGEVYKGEFASGKEDGLGIRGFAVGDDGRYWAWEYQGEFNDGEPSGLGMLKTDDSTYWGQFKKGRRAGFGIMKFANHFGYRGQWSDGMRQGIGEYCYVKKGRQSGAFQCEASEKSDDIPCMRIAGQFQNDKPNGYAVCERGNGETWLGEWRDGKLNGYAAKLNDNNRVIEQGRYRDGKLQ